MSNIAILSFLAVFAAFMVFGRESRQPVWLLVMIFMWLDLLINPYIYYFDQELIYCVLPFKDLILVGALLFLRNTFATLMASVYCLVGISGFALAYDLILDTDIFYTMYGELIAVLYAAQILIGSDGIPARIYSLAKTVLASLGIGIEPSHTVSNPKTFLDGTGKKGK